MTRAKTHASIKGSSHARLPYNSPFHFSSQNAIKLNADDAIAGVHFCVKILQPPQIRVHFGHFVNGNSYKIVPYIPINFIQINRSKKTPQVGGNLVLIEQSSLEQRHDELHWFYQQYELLVVSILSFTEVSCEQNVACNYFIQTLIEALMQY